MQIIDNLSTVAEVKCNLFARKGITRMLYFCLESLVLEKPTVCALLDRDMQLYNSRTGAKTSYSTA